MAVRKDSLSKLEPMVVTMTSSSLPKFDETTSSIGSTPLYANRLDGVHLDTADLVKSRRRRRDLFLRGLPDKLCIPGAIQLVLRSANLSDAAEQVHLTWKGAMSVRCAVIRARTVEDVTRLARFFHGRRFGKSSPIEVSFAVGQGTDKPSEGLREVPLTVNLRCSESDIVSSSCSTASVSPRSSSFSDAPTLKLQPPPGLEMFVCGG